MRDLFYFVALPLRRSFERSAETGRLMERDNFWVTFKRGAVLASVYKHMESTQFGGHLGKNVVKFLPFVTPIHKVKITGMDSWPINLMHFHVPEIVTKHSPCIVVQLSVFQSWPNRKGEHIEISYVRGDRASSKFRYRCPHVSKSVLENLDCVFWSKGNVNELTVCTLSPSEQAFTRSSHRHSFEFIVWIGCSGKDLDGRYH
mmetsp:Transcript_11770/g.22616  ORF Transcript_11770/g.22616 Transcript_11770/m.22616 type:complete len:202 (-) Transcript_11770:1488-2093(-)